MKQKELNVSDLPKEETKIEEGTNFTYKEVSPEKIINSTKEKNPEHLSEIVGIKDKKNLMVWVKGLSKKQKVAIAIAFLLSIIAYPLYLGITVLTAHPASPASIIALNNSYYEAGIVSKSLYQKAIALAEPSEPKTKESPINGVRLTEAEYANLMQRLPVAVMVNNHEAARPQSSTTTADIIFETIAEAGITRYMAVYWANDVNVVGPIRSARQYYIEWLSPFDAIYLHDGYASSDDPRVDAGGNIYKYDIKSLATYGAWREYDGVRVAPHNEYTSPIKAWERAKVLKWGGLSPQFESWKFKRDALKEDRGTVTGAHIVFWERLWNGGMYDVDWAYDSETNQYLRSIAKEKDIDQENDRQVSAKVVIIQSVKMTPTGDAKAHLIIETIGTGNAVILQDGKRIDGTWKKASRTARTKFYDATGAEVEFNRGLIWVEAVPKDDGKFDIIQK